MSSEFLCLDCSLRKQLQHVNYTLTLGENQESPSAWIRVV